MKAYFINASEHTIEVTEWHGELDQLREAVGGYIETAMDFGNGDFCLVNEEGFFKENPPLFKFRDIESQWFAGNGIIINEDCDVVMPIPLVEFNQDPNYKPPPPKVHSWTRDHLIVSHVK